jgi:two-component system chemotaxis response regulator CheY
MSDKTRNRILVVEDAGLVRRYYRQILEGAGYVVDEALNGVEAMERLMGQSFDLLIVDVNMPQMDGVTFLNALRKQNLPMSGTPALIISTEAGAQDRNGAISAGANFYLTKPAQPELLRTYVALLCGVAA